jgi:peptidoglycan/LPS O-acetylase OafA/YrhL
VGTAGSRGTFRVARLDGLRGVAVAAVLVYHAWPQLLPGGFLGVEVFFVLSGYLVTTTLLDRFAARGTIDARRFWLGRVHRLVPAAAVLLVALAVALPRLAADDAAAAVDDLLAGALGFTNWHLLAEGASYFDAAGRPSVVRHLWSLAVEVQFYVAAPLLVAGLASRRHARRWATAVLAAGALASTVAMAALYTPGDPSRAYFGTDSRVAGLLLGAALAWWWPVPAPGARHLRSSRVLAIGGWAATAVLAGAGVWVDETGPALYRGGFVVVRVAAALLVVSAVHANGSTFLLSARPLRWLGERSYSVYLWHWPLVVLVTPVWVSIPASLLLGHLSHRLVERPFAHGVPASWRTPTPRRRLVPALSAATFGVAVVVGAVLLASAPATNPIVASLHAGQRVLEEQAAAPATTAPRTTTTHRATTTSTPSTAAPQTVATVAATTSLPPTTVPPAPPPADVVAVGDSVMLGAAGALKARLGEGSWIDAATSRQFRAGIDALARLRDEGRLGSVVVVHLGNNGTATDADLDALMAVADGVPRVVLVNVRVPKEWQDAVNTAVAAAATRSASVRLVDWYAHSEGHPEWFGSDGLHLTAEGAAAYADLVAAATV